MVEADILELEIRGMAEACQAYGGSGCRRHFAEGCPKENEVLGKQ